MREQRATELEHELQQPQLARRAPRQQPRVHVQQQGPEQPQPRQQQQQQAQPVPAAPQQQPQPAAAQDLPFMDPTNMSVFEMCKVQHELGLKAALSAQAAQFWRQEAVRSGPASLAAADL